MLQGFLHRKTLPFWKNYLRLIKITPKATIENTRFVVIDTETTGLNHQNDRILSIGAIAVQGNDIIVSDSFEVFLSQDNFRKETVAIHGILKEGANKIEEPVALEKFVNYIGNAVLIAHHAAFDLKMINAALGRMKLPSLKNKIIDTGNLYRKLAGKNEENTSLDELCKIFNVAQHDRHIAAGDACLTALIFLKIFARLKKERNIHFSDLFRATPKKGLL